MIRQARVFLILGGMLVGSIGTLIFIGWSGSPAQAQAPAKAAENGRYQISA